MIGGTTATILAGFIPGAGTAVNAGTKVGKYKNIFNHIYANI